MNSYREDFISDSNTSPCLNLCVNMLDLNCEVVGFSQSEESLVSYIDSEPFKVGFLHKQVNRVFDISCNFADFEFIFTHMYITACFVYIIDFLKHLYFIKANFKTILFELHVFILKRMYNPVEFASSK